MQRDTEMIASRSLSRACFRREEKTPRHRRELSSTIGDGIKPTTVVLAIEQVASSIIDINRVGVSRFVVSGFYFGRFAGAGFSCAGHYFTGNCERPVDAPSRYRAMTSHSPPPPFHPSCPSSFRSCLRVNLRTGPARERGRGTESRSPGEQVARSNRLTRLK